MPRIVDLLWICLFDNTVVLFLKHWLLLVLCVRRDSLAIIEIMFGLAQNVAHILRLQLLLVLAQRVSRLQREERSFGSHGKSGLFRQSFVPCNEAIDVVCLLPLLLHLPHPSLITAISRQIIVQILFVERYVQLFCLWSGLASVDDAEGRLVVGQYGMVVLCCGCLVATTICCLLLS